MPLALRIENLWKSYSAGVRGCSARVWVLRGCRLHVELGERVAIVGARGSGKSTLLQCIAGSRRLDAGTINALLPVRGSLSVASLTPVASATDNGPGLLLVDGHLTAPVPASWAGSLVMSSHDVASVHPLVDRVLLLRDGHLLPLSRPAVRRVAEPRFDAARSDRPSDCVSPCAAVPRKP